MIDLTPLDVRKKRGDFRQKLRGYDPEEVDTFLELVEDRLENLVRDNRMLEEKVRALESRLETLEGRERAVQEALVTAQTLRKEVQEQTLKDAEALEEQSKREIELLRREAEAELEARFLEAQDLMRERQRALEEMERNRQKFLKAFRSLLERELDAVEVEEARRPLDEAPLDIQLRGWKRKEVLEETATEDAGPVDVDVADAPGPEDLASPEAQPEEDSEEEDEAREASDSQGEDGEKEPEIESSVEVGLFGPEESEEGEEPLWLSALLDREEGEREEASEGMEDAPEESSDEDSTEPGEEEDSERLV